MTSRSRGSSDRNDGPAFAAAKRTGVVDLTARVFVAIESVVGGVLSLVIAFELFVGAILTVVYREPLPRYLSIPLAGMLLIAEFWLIGAVWRCLSTRRFPLAPNVAVRQPLLPIALRPIAALLWFVHWPLLLFSAYAFSGVVDMFRQTGGTGVEAAVMMIVFYLLGFACAFIANIYLLLAVTALTRSRSPLEAIWKRRFIISGLLGLATFVLPMLERAA